MTIEFEELIIEEEAIPASKLDWPGASYDQLEFMKDVYETCVKRSSARGSFIGDIPSDELAVIEGGHRAKKRAAAACKLLLEAVRSEIEKAELQVVTGITSGYRSASTQLQLWQKYFPAYYNDTSAKREEMKGGKHGPEAIQYMAGYTGARIATPGFSNHQNGIAVDFLNKERGKTLANSTKPAALKAWKQTWLWEWLKSNANGFGFYQNTKIDEPWHWEYREQVSEEDIEENGDAILMTPYRQSSPALETIYVKIPLALGKEWGDKEKTVRYLTEPKTGIHLPLGFKASEETELLLFLHGHKSAALGKDKSVDRWWDVTRFPQFGLREILNDSGRNLLLAVPTLGPRSQAGNLVTAEGFSNFIERLTEGVNQHCYHHLGGKTISIKNIILACHSGGGDAMRRIAVLSPGNHYTDLISECWGFDSMYSSIDAATWLGWARANPHKKVYQYFIPNTSTAVEGNQLKLAASKAGISNVFAINSVEKRHDWVPAHYLKERLIVNPGITAKEYDEQETCCCENETTTDIETENTIVFPSGNTLNITAGQEEPGDEYYDPNQSGNPLLDTSGNNRNILLSKNIQVGEIARSGGKLFDKARIDPELIKCLQAIRDKTGKPININSGYRSYGYNQQLQSKSKNVATKSQHMSGRAADIRINGMNGLEIARTALDAYGCNIGIGLAPGFAHIDVRGRFNAWRYAGDPASMDQQLQQLRQYRNQCVEKGKAGTKVLEEPLTYMPVNTIINYLKTALSGAEKLLPSVLSEQRASSTAELHTSWTAEEEKILNRKHGGTPRNLARQNDFNQALMAAQSEWDQLDPLILKSLLAQESGFSTTAVNNLGFAGIAQLGMKEAQSVGLSTGSSKEQTSEHRRRKALYLKEYFDFDGDERFDATKSIQGAARLLKKKWQSLNRGVFQTWGYPLGDDLHRFVLGANNGGEGTVKNRVSRIYGPVCMDHIRFDEMGTGEWIKYANIIVERARQNNL
ncbi:D-alanyl-D-alanine carboxypeptidase family protein [Flavihumibacter sp. ZG627]|uniref:D-alanyl-D-alanine carboxypeptidase family protein n=1 Tax=Flavihumibacter sp. ZG627 TaxID=1463156 RepID=UPI000694292D|nr:D-alanyl-D-alanine carboxypeptidase family protein [Flavihumibacter sp. ZG627]